jgi:hypothetical protein
MSQARSSISYDDVIVIIIVIVVVLVVVVVVVVVVIIITSPICIFIVSLVSFASKVTDKIDLRQVARARMWKSNMTMKLILDEGAGCGWTVSFVAIETFDCYSMGLARFAEE